MPSQRIGDVEKLAPCVAKPEDTVLDAARRMVDQGVCLVAVVDGQGLKGTLTIRELVKRVVLEGHNPAKTRLKDVMMPNPVAAGEWENWHDVLAKMEHSHCCYMPVTDGKNVTGTASTKALLRHEVADKQQEIKDINERWDYLPPESGFGG